jgi:AraC-like DNA-binding protein
LLYIKNDTQMIRQNSFYFSISERDRRWGFQVTGAGHAETKPAQFYPPRPGKYDFTWERGRRLEEFALVYLVAGGGKFESEHQSLTTLKAGQALILFPGEWHRYRPHASVGWEEYWVTFGGKMAEAWLRAGFLDPGRPVVRESLGLSLAPAFQELLRQASQKTSHGMFVLSGLCHVLVGRVLAAIHAPHTEKSEEAIMKAADYLRLHADEAVDLPMLARKTAMSYSGFRRAFTRHLGLPPHRFHQQARLALAKDLLATTDLPLKSVAEQLDYPSEFYLMQQFKRLTGLTPTQWRKRGRDVLSVKRRPRAKSRRA